MIKLDYSIESPEERKKLVEQIIEENPNLSNLQLESLANYLILCMEKEEKKEKQIITQNRQSTIDKRETSFDGLADSFENGEDGVYNLITNDKNIIFRPKISITKEDIAEVPFLAQLRQSIEDWEQGTKHLTGKTAYIAKKALIEMRKDQYIIKNFFRSPIVATKLTHSKKIVSIPSSESIDLETGEVRFSGASFCDPKVVSIVLCNYSKLRQTAEGNFEGDLWFFMEDFDNISESALADEPILRRIVEYKIDGVQNWDIQSRIKEEFDLYHSEEYYSTLWRKKIPKLIADEAIRQLIVWSYWREGPNYFKTCTKCGKAKPAHTFFFSKNKKGYYSICKECRRGSK